MGEDGKSKQGIAVLKGQVESFQRKYVVTNSTWIFAHSGVGSNQSSKSDVKYGLSTVHPGS